MRRAHRSLNISIGRPFSLSLLSFSPIFSYLEPQENALDPGYQRFQGFHAEVGLLAGWNTSDHAPASRAQDAVRSEKRLGVLVELHSRLCSVEPKFNQQGGEGGGACRRKAAASLIACQARRVESMPMNMMSTAVSFCGGCHNDRFIKHPMIRTRTR